LLFAVEMHVAHGVVVQRINKVYDCASVISGIQVLWMDIYWLGSNSNLMLSKIYEFRKFTEILFFSVLSSVTF
jgi:hypothetical protein